MSYYSEKGFKRFTNSILFSIAGLKATWQHEEAFRQEVIILVVILPIVYMLDHSVVEKILLIGSVVLILIVELINSAIEAIVDRVGTEHHVLSGRAKDIGSAAVMVSILLSIAIWLIILI